MGLESLLGNELLDLPSGDSKGSNTGQSDSMNDHLLEVHFETATVPESRQTLLYTHPLWVVVVYRIGLPKYELIANRAFQGFPIIYIYIYIYIHTLL